MNTVNQGKELLTSKTFWGFAVGMLAMILQNFGMQIDVSHVASDIVGVMGLILGIAGLVVRKGPINSVFGIKTPAGKKADAAKNATTDGAK